MDGTTKDWAYGRLGIAALHLRARAPSSSKSCAPFEITILPDNLGCPDLCREGRAAVLHSPAGPDVVSCGLRRRSWSSRAWLQLIAVADDTRYEVGRASRRRHRCGRVLPGPPAVGGWRAPNAMDAADGSFDAPSKRSSPTSRSAGSAIGRHAVFIEEPRHDGGWGRGDVSVLLDPRSGDGGPPGGRRHRPRWGRAA